MKKKSSMLNLDVNLFSRSPETWWLPRPVCLPLRLIMFQFWGCSEVYHSGPWINFNKEESLFRCWCLILWHKECTWECSQDTVQNYISKSLTKAKLTRPSTSCLHAIRGKHTFWHISWLPIIRHTYHLYGVKHASHTYALRHIQIYLQKDEHMVCFLTWTTVSLKL